MKRILWLAICLVLSLTAYSPPVFAQTASQLPADQIRPTIQQEKEKFLHGFYSAYMSSIIYDVKGLGKLLKDKYVEQKLAKQSTDADIFLDAQDCIEENLKTLNVDAIDDNWYKVSFLWPSPYPTIPTRQHIILVKVSSSRGNYKIVDIQAGK